MPPQKDQDLTMFWKDFIAKVLVVWQIIAYLDAHGYPSCQS